MPRPWGVRLLPDGRPQPLPGGVPNTASKQPPRGQRLQFDMQTTVSAQQAILTTGSGGWTLIGWAYAPRGVYRNEGNVPAAAVGFSNVIPTLADHERSLRRSRWLRALDAKCRASRKWENNSFLVEGVGGKVHRMKALRPGWKHSVGKRPTHLDQTGRRLGGSSTTAMHSTSEAGTNSDRTVPGKAHRQSRNLKQRLESGPVRHSQRQLERSKEEHTLHSRHRLRALDAPDCAVRQSCSLELRMCSVDSERTSEGEEEKSQLRGYGGGWMATWNVVTTGARGGGCSPQAYPCKGRKQVGSTCILQSSRQAAPGVILRTAPGSTLTCAGTSDALWKALGGSTLTSSDLLPRVLDMGDHGQSGARPCTPGLLPLRAWDERLVTVRVTGLEGCVPVCSGLLPKTKVLVAGAIVLKNGS
ncbi:hypothetical protein LXA43DRAFT_1082547 [Ganoderma leucocontextum]|nr:hypothetical protein LXA43DRAFT_1082547 [Ganoderma leucocontextum]